MFRLFEAPHYFRRSGKERFRKAVMGGRLLEVRGRVERDDAVIHVIAWQYLPREALQDWLWESWRFVKQIFPLLVVGVFVVGMARVLVRPEWIEAVAGSNSLVGNLAGVAFGVFMYFPTLVEVPIARMFLDLGMHRGAGRKGRLRPLRAGGGAAAAAHRHSRGPPVRPVAGHASCAAGAAGPAGAGHGQPAGRVQRQTAGQRGRAAGPAPALKPVQRARRVTR